MICNSSRLQPQLPSNPIRGWKRQPPKAPDLLPAFDIHSKEIAVADLRRVLGDSAWAVYVYLLSVRDRYDSDLHAAMRIMHATFEGISRETALTYDQVKYGFKKLKAFKLIVPIGWRKTTVRVWNKKDIYHQKLCYQYYVLGEVSSETYCLIPSSTCELLAGTTMRARKSGTQGRKTLKHIKLFKDAVKVSKGRQEPCDLAIRSTLLNSSSVKNNTSHNESKNGLKVSQSSVTQRAAHAAPSGACPSIESRGRINPMQRLPPPPPLPSKPAQTQTAVGERGPLFSTEKAVQVHHLPLVRSPDPLPQRRKKFSPPSIAEDPSYKYNGVDRIMHDPFLNDRSSNYIRIPSIPKSPLIPDMLFDHEMVKILIKCYQEYYQFVEKKKCFAFARGDIRQSKHYEKLVAAAHKLKELNIRPMYWVKFTKETWQHEDKNTGFPPITYVFNAARIEKLETLYEDLRDDDVCTVPIAAKSPLRELWQASQRMKSFMFSKDENMNQDDINQYMNNHFPGTKWLELLNRCKAEIRNTNMRYEERVSNFEYVWGELSGQ